MMKCARRHILGLVFLPALLIGDLDDEDFDDTDFLASKEVAPSSDVIGWSLFRSSDSEDRYTINFTNVSIIEYVRFVSKISGTNFIYEQGDLDFNVSIVSEEPITLKNIMSALIQTLRIHGLTLLEQDNNLLITKSTDVNQIATIVGPDNKKGKSAPIVTRIFRIKNASLGSVASIVKPMTSKAAFVEVMNETRQLIVTDIATNVEKIATLLQSIDAPHSPLDIEIYSAHHISVDTLVELASKIVAPFSEDNPLIYVPQPETNSIFIVSTPYLIERSMEVMEDLDVKPKGLSPGQLTKDQAFLYKIKHKTHDELLKSIKQISKELKGTGAHSAKLIDALENAKWVKDSNSILFVTDKDTQKKIEDILKTLDTFSDTRNFYVYKILKAGVEQIENSLHELAKSVKKTGTDSELVDSISSMRYIRETNSFIFTGTDESLKKLEQLLPTFDVAVSEYAPSSHYWLYTPQYLSGKELKKALDDILSNMESSGLADEPLLNAIESVRWVPATNTLLFTGDPGSLNHIQSIIKLIDVPSGAPSKIFLYQPKYVSSVQIEEALDELADKLDHKNLSDRNLASAIDNMTWIQESQAFLFKSDPASIAKIEEFLKEIDNKKEGQEVAQAYYLYTLKYARGDDVIDHLEKIAKNLPEKDPTQKAIVDVIDDVSFLKETNALLLTGAQKAVDEVKNLIAQFDVEGSTPTALEKTSFFIYRPKNVAPPQLQDALKQTANDLKQSGLIDPTLLESIDTMRLVEVTDSLVFTGSKESLEKTKEILEVLDVPGDKDEATGEFAGHSFYIYKVQYESIDSLKKQLDTVVKNLQKENGSKNRQMIKTLKAAKEIKETNSILFTGPPAILEKVADLLKQLDSPSKGGEGAEIRAPGTYVIYKPQNVSGPELIEMMGDFEQNLISSGVREPNFFETVKNLKYVQRTGYILISGDAKSVEKVQELLKKFDQPGLGEGVTAIPEMETSFLVYKLHYHTGTEIQETLKKIGQELSASDPTRARALMTTINSIQYIKMTNSLLATGSPEILTKLKELIQNVDVPLRQVFIEVLIIQTTVTNNQQFGLQWGGKVQYLDRFAAGTGNFPAPNAVDGIPANQALATPLGDISATRTPTAADIPVPTGVTTNTQSLVGGWDLGVIGDIILHKGKSFISLGSLVNALQQDNDSTIVMNPKIIAQDNQQSTIFVGQNIPFAGSIVQTVGGTAQQNASNIEYRDVGVNLSITPILGTDDIVTLSIINDITSQVENTTSGINGIQGLQTSRTSLNARVHVPNKHFVALSGMIEDTKSHFKSSIPCLGGIPIIGAFFSENDRLNQRNNVVFFLRPVIIDSAAAYKEVTENQENLFKERASKQILKEEIDDAIDWIKTPENE